MAGRRILIVEDNATNRELVRSGLSAVGYDARAVGSAEEALETLRVFTPALVLLDVRLPGVNGLDLARILKSDPATSGIVLVAHTAFAGPQDADDALSAGCDAYVSKPTSLRALIEVIATHLGGSS